MSHRRLEMEFKKKKRNKEYFFYLLFLDFYQDDSLSYYLLSNEVKEDVSESYWKGIWLYLLERNHLLGRISFIPMKEYPHVFKKKQRKRVREGERLP